MTNDCRRRGQKNENCANYLLASGFDFIRTMKRGFDIIPALLPELIGPVSLKYSVNYHASFLGNRSVASSFAKAGFIR